MTFILWAALAIAGFVAAPIFAHLLRRGRAREQEFPAAALVAPLTSTARQRSRLEDWPLLVLRSLIVVGLAVLGATPLVRCQRLTLARASGASVALAIVMDDSLSMRSRTPDGRQRFLLAKAGAEELLEAAREGDAVAIVLAGSPARIALAPTSDLRAAERALGELTVSDRSTDLAGAVELARSALRALPQQDHRIVALSDLAAEPIPDGTPGVSAPLPALARPVKNCGITSAERRGSHVTVAVACSADDAARGRSVEVVVADDAPAPPASADAGPSPPPAKPGDVVLRVELPPRAGEQSVVMSLGRADGALDARLTGSDASAHDDLAPVSDESSTRLVGVVADTTLAAAKTGGPTVIEQALSAIGDTWSVRPLPFVPDDSRGLDGLRALVIDDPRGFSPEARATLAQFFDRGGVAAALLGPRSAATELGWTLEPFGRGAARWEVVKGLGIAPASVAWLGPEAESLAGIGRGGRVRLDGMLMDGARAVGAWTDGVPWLLERRVERGLAITVGLPASLDESDLAVRPAFLALLDHVLHQADQRAGSRRTMAGGTWTFPETKRVTISGPDGPVPTVSEPSDEACADPGAGPSCGGSVLRARTAVRGRYVVHLDGATESRVVTLDPAEILAEPRPAAASGAAAASAGRAPLDVTREVALGLILLFAAELGVRIVRKLWPGARRTAPAG